MKKLFFKRRGRDYGNFVVGNWDMVSKGKPCLVTYLWIVYSSLYELFMQSPKICSSCRNPSVVSDLPVKCGNKLTLIHLRKPFPEGFIQRLFFHKWNILQKTFLSIKSTYHKFCSSVNCDKKGWRIKEMDQGFRRIIDKLSMVAKVTQSI